MVILVGANPENLFGDDQHSISLLPSSFFHSLSLPCPLSLLFFPLSLYMLVLVLPSPPPDIARRLGERYEYEFHSGYERSSAAKRV